MTVDNAIAILRRMQEPEPFEPQITESAFNALDMAISALEGKDINGSRDNTMAWTDKHKSVPFDSDELTDDEYLQCTKPSYDPVNHPYHYTADNIECIDAMEHIFGRDAVIHFCMCNVFKYLWRRKYKDSEEQDTAKAIWYFNKAKELINK